MCKANLLLYSLDSKHGGLLSKRGSVHRTSPLVIHYTQGAYYPDYTIICEKDEIEEVI